MSVHYVDPLKLSLNHMNHNCQKKECEKGQTWPNLVSIFRGQLIPVMFKIVRTTSQESTHCVLNDLGSWTAEMRPWFCAHWLLWVSLCNTHLTLVPPLPNVRAVWSTPTAHGLGQSRACWDWGGGLLGVSWHCAAYPLTAWPDWGQKGRLLRLRLMRTGLWSGYRVLQNSHPAGTSCPLCRMAPSPPYSPYRNS